MSNPAALNGEGAAPTTTTLSATTPAAGGAETGMAEAGSSSAGKEAPPVDLTAGYFAEDVDLQMESSWMTVDGGGEEASFVGAEEEEEVQFLEEHKAEADHHSGIGGAGGAGNASVSVPASGPVKIEIDNGSLTETSLVKELKKRLEKLEKSHQVLLEFVSVSNAKRYKMFTHARQCLTRLAENRKAGKDIGPELTPDTKYFNDVLRKIYEFTGSAKKINYHEVTRIESQLAGTCTFEGSGAAAGSVSLNSVTAPSSSTSAFAASTSVPPPIKVEKINENPKPAKKPSVASNPVAQEYTRCHICQGTIATSNSKMYPHMRTHLQVQYQCPECSEFFYGMKKLRQCLVEKHGISEEKASKMKGSVYVKQDGQMVPLQNEGEAVRMAKDMMQDCRDFNSGRKMRPNPPGLMSLGMSNSAYGNAEAALPSSSSAYTSEMAGLPYQNQPFFRDRSEKVSVISRDPRLSTGSLGSFSSAAYANSQLGRPQPQSQVLQSQQQRMSQAQRKGILNNMMRLQQEMQQMEQDGYGYEEEEEYADGYGYEEEDVGVGYTDYQSLQTGMGLGRGRGSVAGISNQMYGRQQTLMGPPGPSSSFAQSFERRPSTNTMGLGQAPISLMSRPMQKPYELGPVARTSVYDEGEYEYGYEQDYNYGNSSFDSTGTSSSRTSGAQKRKRKRMKTGTENGGGGGQGQGPGKASRYFAP